MRKYQRITKSNKTKARSEREREKKLSERGLDIFFSPTPLKSERDSTIKVWPHLNQQGSYFLLPPLSLLAEVRNLPPSEIKCETEGLQKSLSESLNTPKPKTHTLGGEGLNLLLDPLSPAAPWLFELDWSLSNGTKSLVQFLGGIT